MATYDKLYDEIYALVAIHTAYPNSVDYVKKGEHPDWFDDESSLGIEIVRAMTPHMGYVRSFANIYLGKDINAIPFKTRDGFLGDLITQSGRLIGISDSKGSVEGTRHIKLSIEATKSKLSLLNKSHFRVFNQNELFIYVPFTINDSDLELFLDLYKQLENRFVKKFSKVFLFDNSKLYAIKALRMETDTYEYSNEQLRLMKKISFMLKDETRWGVDDRFATNYSICKENLLDEISKDN